MKYFSVENDEKEYFTLKNDNREQEQPCCSNISGKHMINIYIHKIIRFILFGD